VRFGQRLELPHQLVELGVGDLGLVVAVVPLAVVADLGREVVGARGDLAGHCSGRAGHRPQSTDRVRR
jgi:hypothetical protein